MLRSSLIAIGFGCLVISTTGCQSAGGHQSAVGNHDVPPPVPSPDRNPPKFVQRGDQIYELMLSPRGGTHTVIPPGSIRVGGHVYIPKGVVVPPPSDVPLSYPPNGSPFGQPGSSTPLPMPSKEKSPTSFGRGDVKVNPLEDDVIPRAEITGVRAMTKEEVEAWEKSKKAAEAKPPSATLGAPIPDPNPPTTLPKLEGPLLGEPVMPANPLAIPMSPQVPPPAALPKGSDWKPIPPPPAANDLPPPAQPPVRIRPELTASYQKKSN